eukprot:14271568-Alexandrium_andersonii.AAC.1
MRSPEVEASTTSESPAHANDLWGSRGKGAATAEDVRDTDIFGRPGARDAATAEEAEDAEVAENAEDAD